MSIAPTSHRPIFSFRVNRHRRRLWLLSTVALLLSFLGMAVSWLSPSIRAPLRPGIDFTGGTQIQIERSCDPACSPLTADSVQASLASLKLPADGADPAPPLTGASVQLLDGGSSLVLRLPSLSPAQSETVLKSLQSQIGDTVVGGGWPWTRLAPPLVPSCCGPA